MSVLVSVLGVWEGGGGNIIFPPVGDGVGWGDVWVEAYVYNVYVQH